MFQHMSTRLIVAACVVGFALVGCSSPAGSTSTGSHSAATTPAASAGTTSCTYTKSGTAAKPATPPANTGVPNTGTVSVVLHMDAGDVTMVLDRSNAPCAVNSLVSLAQQKYFDDTRCHRLVPGFVLQCGDPTGTGTGGPGYAFADELTGKEQYTLGTVAMANAGPNTNGSQFFVVLGANVGLPASYTILGKVDTAGMTVVKAIEAKGGVDPSNTQGSAPAEGGHIGTVTVGA